MTDAADARARRILRPPPRRPSRGKRDDDAVRHLRKSGERGMAFGAMQRLVFRVDRIDPAARTDRDSSAYASRTRRIRGNADDRHRFWRDQAGEIAVIVKQALAGRVHASISAPQRLPKLCF